MYRVAPGEVETFVREWREHVGSLRAIDCDPARLVAEAQALTMDER